VAEIDSDGLGFRSPTGFVWSNPERRPGGRRLIRTGKAVLYVDDEVDKRALLLGELQVPFTAPAYEGLPWSCCGCRTRSSNASAGHFDGLKGTIGIGGDPGLFSFRQHACPMRGVLNRR